MSEEYYACPNNNCKIWEAYLEEGIKNTRRAVIKKDTKNEKYLCPAINHVKNVKENLGLYPDIKIQCVIVKTLNNQEEIITKLNDLSKKLK